MPRNMLMVCGRAHAPHVVVSEVSSSASRKICEACEQANAFVPIHARTLERGLHGKSRLVRRLGRDVRLLGGVGKKSPRDPAGTGTHDLRPRAPRPNPDNALSGKEWGGIAAAANPPEFASLPPARIVPALSGRGIHLASVSTMYRVPQERRLNRRRGRARAPKPSRPKPGHTADGPTPSGSGMSHAGRKHRRRGSTPRPAR